MTTGTKKQMSDMRQVHLNNLPVPGGLWFLGALAAFFHHGWVFWASVFWLYWAMVKVIGLVQ